MLPTEWLDRQAQRADVLHRRTNQPIEVPSQASDGSDSFFQLVQSNSQNMSNLSADNSGTNNNSGSTTSNAVAAGFRVANNQQRQILLQLTLYGPMPTNPSQALSNISGVPDDVRSQVSVAGNSLDFSVSSASQMLANDMRASMGIQEGGATA